MRKDIFQAFLTLADHLVHGTSQGRFSNSTTCPYDHEICNDKVVKRAASFSESSSYMSIFEPIAVTALSDFEVEQGKARYSRCLGTLLLLPANEPKWRGNPERGGERIDWKFGCGDVPLGQL